MNALSPRLAAVAAMVPPGRVVADVGTDHALLPIHLVREGISPRAVAVEKAAGPLAAARRAVAAAGLAERIALREGDGLAPLAPGEATVLVLAGMGGSTMAGILEAGPDVVAAAERLILQPMDYPAAVRRWLADHGWVPVDEQLAADAGRIYQVIGAERGDGRPLTPLELEVGPLLLEQGHPLLREYLAGLAQKYARILAEMARSRRPLPGRREITERLRAVREALRRLDNR
ncbi:MAG: class I SAM-dependent methyltransferase [Bacillota bacterium]|nr:class I SAM-dependent methyltransferase [Bacillota bacterium]